MRVGTRLPPGAWVAHALNGPIASSHGKAIDAPIPLSTVRRDNRLVILLVLSSAQTEGVAKVISTFRREKRKPFWREPTHRGAQRTHRIRLFHRVSRFSSRRD